MLNLFHDHNIYTDDTTSNHTTETLSRDVVFLSNATCQCHLTTCAKLITNGLKGVVCVDHIKVRCNYLNSSYSLIQININVRILSLQACIVG